MNIESAQTLSLSWSFDGAGVEFDNFLKNSKFDICFIAQHQHQLYNKSIYLSYVTSLGNFSIK